MAEEIKLEITVDAQGAEQTLGSLKSKAESLKAEIENEPIGSKRFNELRNEIKKTEGQINKLDDSLKALDPEQTADAFLKSAEGIAGGFAVVTGTMALFGTQSEEVEEALLKVQSALAIVQGIKAMTEGVKGLATAFNVLRTAILANPIGLIITGVVALAAGLVALIVYWDKVSLAIRNFTKNMSDGMKIAIAVMFPFIGAVMYLAGAFDKAALAADALAEAQRKAREAEIDAAETAIRKNQEQIEYIRKTGKAVEERYDFEKRLAEASGKDTVEIEAKKLEAVRSRLEQEMQLLMDSAAQAAKIYKSAFTKDFVGVYEEQANIAKESLTKAEQEIQIFNARVAKQRADKAEEERTKRREAEQAQTIETVDYLKKRVDLVDNANAQIAENTANLVGANVEATERIIDVATARITAFYDRIGEAQAFALGQTSQNLDTLSMMFENSQERQLQAAEGNEAKQEEIRRKFFERNKKVQIAQALISAYQGAVNAFTSTAANPITVAFPAAPYIAAASALAAGLANIQKIRQTQFEGGSDSGGTSGGAPNFGGAPNINNQSVGSTTLNVSNQPTATKVYVVESDITQAQKNVNGIVNKATID